MGHIFISYSHADKAYAHKLHRHLHDQGFDAWIDDRIDFGSRWPREIEKRLKGCAAFILIMSPNSYESEWVQNELSFARQLKKPIFTLLLDGSVWWHLHTTQYVDVTGGKLPPAKFLISLAEIAPRAQDDSASKQDNPEETLRGTIGIGGDVSGSVIVTGNGNVINLGKPESPEKARLDAEEAEKRRLAKEQSDREAADAARIAREIAEKSNHEKVKEPKPVPATQKPSLKVIVAIVGVIVVFVAIFGLPWRQWFAPTPDLVIATPTNTVTFIPAPPTPTKTPIKFFTPTSNAPLSNGIIDSKGVTMLLVPAGEFTMGNDDGADNEKPARQIYLDAFYMDKYEVTNALYKACINAGGCTLPKDTSHYDSPEYENHPVVYIDWNQAQAYCEWRGASLPTEAQWEKAALGTGERVYPWGEGTGCDKANSAGCKGDTNKVGSYENGKSPYGIYDLIGNVAEWTSDWYSDTYYQNSPLSNPVGPDTGRYKVTRGGSFTLSMSSTSGTNRGSYYPGNGYYTNGFRCALSLP